ncbi:spore coat protein CotJB [Clostridiaceae bacterium]|jgi:spore coat protein JB|nr:spore coat protein CotJB [Lachnospiraceae bacterium]NBH18756.1 spore coat protein CotJB [Clostridiaceae bacterium]
MCENQLLQKVYETGFALDEITLYLDTHPMDTQAMAYYQYAKKANQEAVAAYEKVYGPLLINQVNSGSWTWTVNPWPWEGGM